MDLLSPTELEGVMAHELTHVLNRDVVIMTIASFFASIASMIVQFGFFFGGGGHGDDEDSGPSWMFVILVSLVVYVVSFLLMQALSRYREFAADEGAVALTGSPAALASALMKVSDGLVTMPRRDLRQAALHDAFHLLPVSKDSEFGLPPTHPPLKARIERLERLERALQRH
jgi:heat shock protein HtpX